MILSSNEAMNDNKSMDLPHMHVNKHIYYYMLT